MSRSFSGDPEPRIVCRRVSSARKRFSATSTTTIYHFFRTTYVTRQTCAHVARRRPARNPVLALLSSALQTSVHRQPHTSPRPLFKIYDTMLTPRAYSTRYTRKPPAYRCFIYISTRHSVSATIALPRRSADVSRSTSRNRLAIYYYTARSDLSAFAAAVVNNNIMTTMLALLRVGTRAQYDGAAFRRFRFIPLAAGGGE